LSLEFHLAKNYAVLEVHSDFLDYCIYKFLSFLFFFLTESKGFPFTFILLTDLLNHTKYLLKGLQEDFINCFYFRVHL